MAKYRVARGHHWGTGDRKIMAEGIVELDPQDAAMFIPWKLIPVGDTEGPGTAVTPAAVDDTTVDPSVQPEGPGASQEGPEEWGDLPDRLIDLLEASDVFPEDLRTMTDNQIMALEGVGPKYLGDIRAIYPKE